MHPYKLSISTSFNRDLGLAKQLPLIAAAGFSHVSLGAADAQSIAGSSSEQRWLNALLDRYHLGVDTIHGPRLDLDDQRTCLTRLIDVAVTLGTHVVVAHAGPFDLRPDNLPPTLAIVLRSCETIAPVLDRAGVMLALENVMPGPATDLVRLALRELDPRFFGFCYDSAHDQIGGPRPPELIDQLGDRLVAVHLSDRVRDFVDHVPPGDGFINWPIIMQSIGATDFAGPLLLEVLMVHSDEQDPARFLTRAYKRGCALQRFADRDASSGRAHGGLA